MQASLGVPLTAATLFVCVIGGCSSNSAQQRVRTSEIGEKVELTPFVYRVIDTQWLTHLGEGVEQRVPTNRYLTVRLTAMNTGATENVMPAFSLIDPAGNQHAEVTSVGSLEDWLGLVRSVKPAASVEGVVVFDVSPGTYRLRIQDAFDDAKFAVIELPLKFDSPELLPQARPERPAYENLLKKPQP